MNKDQQIREMEKINNDLRFELKKKEKELKKKIEDKIERTESQIKIYQEQNYKGKHLEVLQIRLQLLKELNNDTQSPKGDEKGIKDKDENKI